MATLRQVDSDSEDEYLINIVLRARAAPEYRERPNHFSQWNDKAFFALFRLTKPTVLKLLALVKDVLETATDR